MGTSSSFGGQRGGSLTPSWLGGDSPAPPPGPGQDGGNAPGNDNAPPAPPERVAPAPIAGNHFQTPRTNFTSFAGSGGSDRRKLGRAVSRYVSSSGSSRQAAQRMGKARTAGGALANFLSTARSEGVGEALRKLNLGNLAGQSIEDIFLGLTDYVCPKNGTIDEGIARSAFIETIADLAEIGLTDMDALTEAQVQTVMEHYASHAIEARLCNDIGTKIVFAPDTVQDVVQVQEMLHDFILRGVSDAYERVNAEFDGLTPERSLEFVEHVYEEAFSILQSLAEEEAKKP